MARSLVAVVLTASCIAILATLTLVYQFDLLGSQTWSSSSLPQWHSDTTRPQQTNSGFSDKHGGDPYLLGIGKADITGPVVEINFMGYADPNQLGSGVRQRLYSRAFIIGDVDKPTDRFVYLVLDTQSGDTAVRHGILEGLRNLGTAFAVYDESNVAVTGTHSHSGPAGWLNYLLPQITSRGFSTQSYEAIVQGAVESIRLAHESLSLGHLTFDSVEIADANTNRSPYAYLANPEEERSKYVHQVDKDMTVLRFHRDSDDKDIGILTWFPVHGTSMLGNNTLVTGDNKGLAAVLFENYARRQSSSAAPDFIAGFSQANVGDTSPNVLGAYCESGPEVGQQCDFRTSLCANKTGPCHGRGPHWGLDDAGVASTYEIGRRQYLGARSAYEAMLSPHRIDGTSSRHVLRGSVRSVHSYVDFANRTFTLPNGTLARTCPAALGYSFAAGTTDGPGAFDFKQNNPGDPNANPFWATVRNSLHEPGPDQIECHGVKPILLDVGETQRPYLWSPNIVDIQLLRVGQLYIIVSPGEATTMAGRRWKEALSTAVQQTSNDKRSQSISSAEAPLVVLGGPANSYTHYISTPEEYNIQRYEGASTLYGPHTLDAYINLTLTHLPYLQVSSPPDSSAPQLPPLNPGPTPPIHTNISLSFISPVVVDRPPFWKSFGDVSLDVAPSYTIAAAPTVSASFVGANPRNDLRLGRTFAAVEKFDSHASTWRRVRDDADWSLVFEWRRTSSVLGTSEVTLSWELGWEIGVWGREDTRGTSLSLVEGQTETETELVRRREAVKSLQGRYRFRYYGDAKSLGGSITAFEGVSGEFLLL